MLNRPTFGGHISLKSASHSNESKHYVLQAPDHINIKSGNIRDSLNVSTKTQ